MFNLLSHPFPLLLLLTFSTLYPSLVARNTAVFIEPSYISSSSSSLLSNIAEVSSTHGGREFQVLSMMSWNGEYSPNLTHPLPSPDPFTVSFLQQARQNTSNTLRIWGGVPLCPGPSYSCMLNYTEANITGLQLGQRIMESNLDGVMIYVSPYCNNANCKKETGKYALGIAMIISSYRTITNNTKSIALLSNEWDNNQIIATAHPDCIFSYQTVYYFTSISDCQKDCGSLCGAGENVAYITKAKANYTDILTYLNDHQVRWLGQLQGASTNSSDNPSDYWTALAKYTSPSPEEG